MTERTAALDIDRNLLKANNKEASEINHFDKMKIDRFFNISKKSTVKKENCFDRNFVERADVWRKVKSDPKTKSLDLLDFVEKCNTMKELRIQKNQNIGFGYGMK